MSFESRVIAFSERFLSDRSFQLIVAPALADWEFEGRRGGSLGRAANRAAVLKAVAGALGDDLARVSGSFALLTLLPSCYYVCLLAICFDFFSTWARFVSMVMVILVLSLVPVMVCFWPERRRLQSLE